MIRAVFALLALALLAGALGDRHPPVPDGAPDSTATPQPPALARTAVDQQDRVDDAHRRRESRFFDNRPLLNALPITQEGVRLDIAGVDGDGRTVVIRISPGRHSRSFARAVYRQALVATGDSGADYRLRWER